MPFCTTKKICFLNKEDAEEELVLNKGKYRNGPVNVYQCHICGFYHFTSKGEMNSKLLSKENRKRIDRESEANYWLNKFK